MKHNDTKQAEIDEIKKQMEQLANELEENPQKFGDEAYELAMEDARMHEDTALKRNQDKASKITNNA